MLNANAVRLCLFHFNASKLVVAGRRSITPPQKSSS
jgi:hypothetical protein